MSERLIAPLDEARILRYWRVFGRLVLLVTLVVAGWISLDRALRQRYDFHHFYLDAAYVWAHGALNPVLDAEDADATRQLPFYLPTVPLALAPLAAGGPTVASWLWAGLQVLAMGYCFYRLHQMARRFSGAAHAPFVLTVVVLVSLPATLEAIKFNQLSWFTLALVLGGLAALDRDRAVRAGTLLACAAVLKLLPAIFAGWLLIKRRWAALGAFVVATLVITWVPTSLCFGFEQTVRYHGEWWAHNIAGKAVHERGSDDDPMVVHFADRRNQSIPAVFARLFDPDNPQRVAFQPTQLAATTARWAAIALMFLLLAAYLWVVRKPWSTLDAWQRWGEAAITASAMFVFAPLSRTYYLVWTLPLLVVIGCAGLPAPDRNDRQPMTLLAPLALLIWLSGMIAWAWPTMRAYGVHLWMLIALCALLARVMRLSLPLSAREA